MFSATCQYTYQGVCDVSSYDMEIKTYCVEMHT